MAILVYLKQVLYIRYSTILTYTDLEVLCGVLHRGSHGNRLQEKKKNLEQVGRKVCMCVKMNVS